MPVAAHSRRWPASVAVLVALSLQVLLPAQVSLGPPWVLPVPQGLLLAPLVVANPVRLERDRPELRLLALVLAGAVLVVNTVRLARLVGAIAAGDTLRAGDLVTSALVVLATNLVACSVLLWELDGGGPFARDPGHPAAPQAPDLLFPQQSLDPSGAPAPTGWRPSYLDYAFVAFTLTTAFSPTDTMPLTGRAKLVFMLGAVTSMTTIAVVAARAVNLV